MRYLYTKAIPTHGMPRPRLECVTFVVARASNAKKHSKNHIQKSCKIKALTQWYYTSKAILDLNEDLHVCRQDLDSEFSMCPEFVGAETGLTRGDEYPVFAE